MVSVFELLQVKGGRRSAGGAAEDVCLSHDDGSVESSFK